MSIISLLPLIALMAQAPTSSSPLNFEYFKAKVQPILLAKREGHARCVACHSQGTPMRLQPVAPGAATWTEEDSRKNFDIIRARVKAGNPMATNRVVWEIKGIEVNHGAAVAPDGSRIYVSNEADSTLDVVDATTLHVTNKVKLSGHPNNISIGRDGRRVYVSIAVAPGVVDVVDTASLARVKSIN